MATAPIAHIGPWVEDDLLGLPHDGQRCELLEGALVVNPPPTGLHQLASLRLTNLLSAGCPTDLLAVEALGVRLPDATLFIPDVVVAQRHAVAAPGRSILDVEEVRLVAEVVSPGSRTTDRLTKPALYARAGIPSFWRVELDGGPAVHAYGWEAGAYVEVASAGPGERLVVREPFPLSFDPAALRP